MTESFPGPHIPCLIPQPPYLPHICPPTAWVTWVFPPDYPGHSVMNAPQTDPPRGLLMDGKPGTHSLMKSSPLPARCSSLKLIIHGAGLGEGGGVWESVCWGSMGVALTGLGGLKPWISPGILIYTDVGDSTMPGPLCWFQYCMILCEGWMWHRQVCAVCADYKAIVLCVRGPFRKSIHPVSAGPWIQIHAQQIARFVINMSIQNKTFTM